MLKALVWAAHEGKFVDEQPRLGYVRLLDDEDAFAHAVNWDVAKRARCGQTCRISKVFPDRTFLGVFDEDDSSKTAMVFLPWKVANKGEVLLDLGREIEWPPFHVASVVPGRVRLVEDPNKFRHAFSRFEYDLVNGFTFDKLAHAGAVCRVSKSYVFDKSFVGVFSNGDIFTLPWEAVSEQLVVF
mmetsp:Transcript_95304/g.179179  ORF Transcript_95304/g.179179 Transcript_95304/m.179179 type:complete len:185 (+) Transcript_95304:49-603(+)